MSRFVPSLNSCVVNYAITVGCYHSKYCLVSISGCHELLDVLWRFLQIGLCQKEQRYFKTCKAVRSTASEQDNPFVII